MAFIKSEELWDSGEKMNSEIQELFNKIYLGLKSQNFEQSAVYENGNLRCLYPGPNGLKCAVGFLIPDEKYNESIEHMSPWNLVVEGIVELSDIHIIFLREMQSIHDNACDPEDMRLELESYAKDLGLVIPKE